MKFTKRKGDTSTIRKVWDDDKAVCYGLVGRVDDLLAAGILEEFEGNAEWMFIAEPMLRRLQIVKDNIGATREEALSDFEARDRKAADAKLIGWYNLTEAKVFRNEYDAAWHQDVLVEPGIYPIVVYDYRVNDSDDPHFHNEVSGHCSSVSIPMDGIIQSDEFGARYFGMPIGNYDNKKNAGKPATYTMRPYIHVVARRIMLGDPRYRLLRQYEALKSVIETDDGRTIYTYGIYLKDEEKGADE